MILNFIATILFLITAACTKIGFAPSSDYKNGSKHSPDAGSKESAALNSFPSFVKVTNSNLSKEILEKSLTLYFISDPFLNWKYPLKDLVEQKDKTHWLQGLGFPSNGSEEVTGHIKVVAFNGEDETKGILATSDVQFTYVPRANSLMMILLSIMNTDSRELKMDLKARLIEVGDPQYPSEPPGQPSNYNYLPPEAEPGPIKKNK